MVSRNLKHGLMHVDARSGSVTEPGVQAKPAPAGAVATGHGSRQTGELALAVLLALLEARRPRGHGSHQTGGR